MAKVYIFLAEGFEEIEALTVVDLLRRAEIEIKMVSITGNKNVEGSHQITTIADILFEEEDYKDGEMLVLPGGMPGTMNLLSHEGLVGLIKDYHDQGKKLAAICAAPSILGNIGLLDGKKAICYPGHEEKLKGAIIKNSSVVIDGNIITSKGLGTAIDFSLDIITILKGEEESNRIGDAIQFKRI